MSGVMKEEVTPACAYLVCARPIVAKVLYRGHALAYCCAELTHLKEFMYATRHLGVERIIERVNGGELL